MFQPEDYPDLIVGLDEPDDAAVWKIGDGRLLVVTTDFFTPIVDEAYDFGAIAAANAISDIYAMGGRPIFALNILAVPGSLPLEIVERILQGGAEKVKEAGAALGGGHSIQDDEPKYGLVVVGLVDEAQVMRKSEARPGDWLVLTKPLGSGVTTTALRNGVASAKDVQQATRWMSKLNAPAAAAGRAAGVKAATDVTGFSLLGHALEMAEASGVALTFYLPAIPFLRGAREYAERGQFPGGSADNRVHFGERVAFEDAIDEYDRMLLFDAQTSGGLLMALPPEKVEAFAQAAAEHDLPFWLIGSVEEGKGARVLQEPHPGGPVSRPELPDLWFAKAQGGHSMI